MTNHVLRSGHKLALGQKLGEGGEGAVYTINGQPNFVAKIYGKPLDYKRAEKLEAVCSLRTDKLSAVCAWPIETIYLNGKACGFVMPLVAKATEIHELFGSTGLKRIFPNADWAFLIHVAKNLAAAIHNLHAANIVVGDFNQRNIVVSQDATVKLWDCDSFQVERGSRTFFCTVGVPEFTAPELQSCVSFDGIKRSPQHDRFALAVMVFYLLFLGRHPFSGDPTDRRVISFELQDAIASRKFAYSPNAPAFGVQPPKVSPPVRELGLDLMPFFVKAFETSNRPTAADWYSALSKLESHLSRCSFNPGHAFPQRLKACPWCEYEAKWSIVTFLPTACPPRFVKAFDYAGIVASVKECFFDIRFTIPPEPRNFKSKPLPSIFVVSPELANDLKLAKSRLEECTAEIAKLNELCKPDTQIAEVINRAQAAYRKYQGLKDKEQKLSANAFEAMQKSRQIQGRLDSLALPSSARKYSLLLVLLIFVGFFVFAATMSSVAGIVSSLGISAAAYFAAGQYRAHQLKDLNRAFLLSKSRAVKAIEEARQINAQKLLLESQLNEISVVLKSLRKTDADRIANVTPLLAIAKRSKKTAVDDCLLKQSNFDKALAEYERSMERRRQEYGLRKNAVRTLDVQRYQAATKLKEVSCPNSLRDCRRRFSDAKKEYDRVQRLFIKELEQIRSSSRDRQMTEHLEKYSIEKHNPGRLGSGLIINLKSHGIETAADISRQAVIAVRGFGAKRTAGLVAWRDQLETIFVFDSSRLLTQQERDSARLKFASDFHKAELLLKKTADQLKLGYDSAKQHVSSAERELAVVNEKLGQARANILETP